MLFDQAVCLYVEDKQHGRKPVRPNTLEGYLSAIQRHLMPAWSGREVESITHGEVQAWVDSIELPGAAEKAFKTFRQVVRWLLARQLARMWDYTIGVELPRRPRRRPAALTARQARESLRAMRGEAWECCALVQLSCGLRPCEAIALEWGDLNLSTGEVAVGKGLHEAFGEVYQAPPKSEKSARTVVLPRYAVERLREVKRARRARPGKRLCAMRPSAYRRAVRAWFRARGVAMCAQHLRHTWGTLALQAGAPIETVALMLGHASSSTAYEHYLVPSAALLRDAQRGFARLVSTA